MAVIENTILNLHRIVRAGIPGVIAISVFTSCSLMKQSRLSDGNYLYSGNGQSFQKVSLALQGASLIIYPRSDTKEIVASPFTTKNATLLGHSFDLEVFWSVAKFRPGTANLPQQLNTELNGNLFLGWRWDRYKNTLNGNWINQSLSLGAFGGIGTTRISPSTTNYRTSEEYNGAIASYGLVLLKGIERFSFGLAAGTDYLMDDNRNIWIYNKNVWYGLTLGIKIK